jgi:hypothetical protein
VDRVGPSLAFSNYSVANDFGTVRGILSAYRRTGGGKYDCQGDENTNAEKYRISGNREYFCIQNLIRGSANGANRQNRQNGRFGKQ